MSLISQPYRSCRLPPSSVTRLLAAAARQVLIAGAAVAGVLAITGCGRPAPVPPAATPGLQPPAQGKAQPPMPSVGNEMPTGQLLEPNPPRPIAPAKPAAPDKAFATADEQRQSRRESIENLINEALTPNPTPPFHGGNALGVAERALAPLADTLVAIDLGIRVIVENLRNADTTGYKVLKTAIGDSRDVTMQVDSSQGEFNVTQRALDVAIQGDGFLPVRVYPEGQPDGSVAYTRNGMLYMNSVGDIVVGDEKGYQLLPAIKFPPGVTQVIITQDGDVRVSVNHQEETRSVGQISLALFADSSALTPLGGGLYAESEASGRAVATPAGVSKAGRLLQGHLESSNLDLVREKLRLKFLQSWRAAVVAGMAQAGDAAPGKP